MASCLGVWMVPGMRGKASRGRRCGPAASPLGQLLQRRQAEQQPLHAGIPFEGYGDLMVSRRRLAVDNNTFAEHLVADVIARLQFRAGPRM